MARIRSAALAAFLCLTQSSMVSAASPLTLIDGASGSIKQSSIPQSAVGSGGIVAVLTSPGTPSFFDETNDSNVSFHSYNGLSVITSPGATLSGSSLLSKGNGAAAAASVSASIIVSGITESDVEIGFDETRHGKTLTGIFKAKISSGDEEKVTLIITVPVEVDEEKIVADAKAIYESAKAEAESEVDFESLYDISVEVVSSASDAERVMNVASEAASKSEVKSREIEQIYSNENSTTEASPSATAAMLACDESYSKNYKTARAKLTAWKSRTARGLTVDNFGTSAAQLIKRTMELYDRDTISAAGIAGSVASYRLASRSKLESRMENAIRELFQAQVENLEKSTLKKFNAMLLRKHGKDNEGKEAFYNDNASAVTSALFLYDAALDELEIPSLSLTKAKASQEMSSKVNTALLTFPDSPAAKLKDMKQVTKAVNKQKQPTERKVDLGLDLVAMVRPDGFGNLQGFGGYQLGGNNIIVGIHNDADSPDVIAQFGGKRPPFLRVQPKLKVDIEL